MWQKIKSAPKDGTHLWLYEDCRGGRMGEGYFSAIEQEWIFVVYGNLSPAEPTYWRPLPDPPPDAKRQARSMEPVYGGGDE